MDAQPFFTNTIDVAFALSFSLILVVAYWRGLGREILQLILFAATTLITFFVFSDQIHIQHISNIEPTLKFLAWFGLGMYAATFLVSRLLTKMILGHGSPSKASRIAASLFAAIKVSCMLLALNLSYAIINPNADRMGNMPEIVQQSIVLQTSDDVTEALYRQLADQGILTYSKILERQQTQEQLEKKLGIKLPNLKLPW